MLVDNSQPAHFGADFSDFINTDLFAPANSSSSASPPSDNDSSPPQSPFHSLLTTPPQDLPPAAFPDFGISSLASASPNGSGLAFLDDESLKDPAAYDFMSLPGMNSIAMNYPGMHMPMDLSMGFNMDSVMSIDNASSSDLASYFGIDPALVGTPAPAARATQLETVEEEDESSQDAQPATQKQATKPDEQRERLTLTITPSKVGGHGKSRKGTVQSGGIVKKSASPPSAHASRDKEKSSLLSTTSGQSAVTIAANAAALKRAKFRASSEVSSIGDAEEFFTNSGGVPSSVGNADDLAIDWRPSPEVLAKMTSKEKRQLRNKISARNFRVRRKGTVSFFSSLYPTCRADAYPRIHYYARRGYSRTRPTARCRPQRAWIDSIRESCSAWGDCSAEEDTSRRPWNRVPGQSKSSTACAVGCVYLGLRFGNPPLVRGEFRISFREPWRIIFVSFLTSFIRRYRPHPYPAFQRRRRKCVAFAANAILLATTVHVFPWLAHTEYAERPSGFT